MTAKVCLAILVFFFCQNLFADAHIGILVHGRHVQTENWETLIWGAPPDKMGSLPRLVYEILRRGPENVGMIVLGTGASERDGLKEAECMKQYLQACFDDIIAFPLIKNHPRFQSAKDRFCLMHLIDKIHCEVASKNTAEEVRAAAALFEGLGCTEIYQISCGSHIARCLLESLKAGHRWYGVPDDMTFARSEFSDVVVVEPPHRGDDPMISADIKMHEVVRKLFKLPQERRIRCLHDIDALIENAL